MHFATQCSTFHADSLVDLLTIVKVQGVLSSLQSVQGSIYTEYNLKACECCRIPQTTIRRESNATFNTSATLMSCVFVFSLTLVAAGWFSRAPDHALGGVSSLPRLRRLCPGLSHWQSARDARWGLQPGLQPGLPLPQPPNPGPCFYLGELGTGRASGSPSGLQIRPVQ